MSTPSAQETRTFHGGRLVARRLKAHGVSKLFTLSGGHLFSIYDGCREEGIDIVDVRHESTAAFAAEGWAKVTREPGVCALTAGPGVTNGMSAMASAQANHSPMVVLGGRAPALRWGQGSLQEIDHVPFVRPLTKLAATAESTEEIPGLVDDAFAAALRPARRAGVRGLPARLRVHGGARAGGRTAAAEPRVRTGGGALGGAIERAGELLRGAERPVIMAGTDLYWGHGEEALAELAQTLRIPVFLNGLARGCVAADHELFFSRARSQALKGADVALVMGVPMDFRLGFGGAFGEETEIVVIDAAEPERSHPRAVAAECYGAIGRDARGLARGGGGEGAGERALDLRAARGRDRAARGRAGGAGGRSGAAASDAAVRGAREGARARRDRDRRRRRLRVLRGARGRQLPAGLLAGPGAVRLPGHRAGLCAGGEARATASARWCCCSATARSASRAWISTRWRATA